MRDTYRRYSAIQQGLLQFFQPHPTGHQARHLNTLVVLICGLCGGQRAHLSTIADHAPADGADQESVITRFRRWLKHDAYPLNGWFLPVAATLRANLAHQPLTLVLDGSVVGRGCVALMLSVVYHGRALPLAWIVVKGKKGHFPQQTHSAVLAQIQDLIAWLKRLHRRDRCDLSLFRLGLRLLARCLKDAIPIPEGFLVPVVLPSKPIRQPMKRAA